MALSDLPEPRLGDDQRAAVHRPHDLGLEQLGGRDREGNPADPADAQARAVERVVMDEVAARAEGKMLRPLPARHHVDQGDQMIELETVMRMRALDLPGHSRAGGAPAVVEAVVDLFRAQGLHPIVDGRDRAFLVSPAGGIGHALALLDIGLFLRPERDVLEAPSQVEAGDLLEPMQELEEIPRAIFIGGVFGAVSMRRQLRAEYQIIGKIHQLPPKGRTCMS